MYQCSSVPFDWLRLRDAFGHLKAIAVDKGGRALLKKANVEQDAGVVDTNNKDGFIAAAKRANGIGKSPFEHWHNRCYQP